MCTAVFTVHSCVHCIMMCSMCIAVFTKTAVFTVHCCVHFRLLCSLFTVVFTLDCCVHCISCFGSSSAYVMFYVYFA